MVRKSGCRVDLINDYDESYTTMFELTYFGNFSPPRVSQTLKIRNLVDLKDIIKHLQKALKEAT